MGFGAEGVGGDGAGAGTEGKVSLTFLPGPHSHTASGTVMCPGRLLSSWASWAAWALWNLGVSGLAPTKRGISEGPGEGSGVGSGGERPVSGDTLMKGTLAPLNRVGKKWAIHAGTPKTTLP